MYDLNGEKWYSCVSAYIRAGAARALNMNQKRISLTESTVLVRIQTATTVLNFNTSLKKEKKKNTAALRRGGYKTNP